MPTDSGRMSMMDAIIAGEPVRMQICDKAAPFQNPVKSMLNGQHFTNRHKYEDHLKQNDCHIVEAGEHGRKKDLQGDFNVRKELTEATRTILNK